MSEFDLINQYFKTATADRDDVLLGIGDDCAILTVPEGKQLAVSTDTLISGVHFPENTSAEDIGYKSLAVNLSDLAAMGATPAWVSLAISLPEINHQWLADFINGFKFLANEFNLSLIGGDTTCGPLSITVNITGFVEPSTAIKRSGAKTGDLIFVSGTLGDAVIGLDAVLNNKIITSDIHTCLTRLNRPTPAIHIGKLLTNIATSAIDISDGLVADLTHICKASSVGANIYLERIPLSQSLLAIYNNQPNWMSIVSGGDDYELCFTCPPEKKAELEKTMSKHNLKITHIGEITNSHDINFKLNNQNIDINKSGYNHF